MGNIGDLRAEALNEARLADARLADNEGHLTGTGAYAIPAIVEQTQFVLASDKGSETGGSGCSKPTAYATPLDNAIELDGAFEIFELPRAQILNHEHSGNQVMNRGGDQDGIGSGCALDVRSDVGYGAENIRFAIRAVAD